MKRFLRIGAVVSLLLGAVQRTGAEHPTSDASGTIRLQASSRKPLKTVCTPRENIIDIRTVPGDPTAVLLVGVRPDVTRVELTDVDGKTESFEVTVLSPHFQSARQHQPAARRIFPSEGGTPHSARQPDDFELFLESIIEAPRGQRRSSQNGRYVPPSKSAPTFSIQCRPQSKTAALAGGGPSARVSPPRPGPVDAGDLSGQ